MKERKDLNGMGKRIGKGERNRKRRIGEDVTQERGKIWKRRR